jgi:hypothetical protein
MDAPSRPHTLLEGLLADEQRRLTVQQLELDAQAAACRARLDGLARQRAALEAQIAKEG